ncbi:MULTISPECIES: helix-turn-helix domain-containing protein [Corynebacterium]|uniref:Helix-turn-helix transcriptional regulator n=1 Tax=Corynebacterium amycolatum TaxID=43765 RepID=A0AAW9SY15_CORAY|nr:MULTISPECIES: helix-turn-helix transcriptional regulator [Corynebacterium]MBC6761338.1 XRE family transcriptional regulator [Corynebacterium sp. LK27]MDK7236735.1 helix-turn-helix transcriptional regulator [Corynebacterium amycolatum]MDK7246556.1 helix-turn-helix transcriptional regulator [Corynebacterium amycolatum]OHR33899.1 hypothetical protein HMPREF2847_08645 [Corynebacterium sp. HMSC074C03]
MASTEWSVPNRRFPDWPKVDVADLDTPYRELWEFTYALQTELDTAIRQGWVVGETEFALRVGISEKTLRRYLRGETWPSVQSIAVMEHALDTRLWPRRRLRCPRNRPLWRRGN